MRRHSQSADVAEIAPGLTLVQMEDGSHVLRNDNAGIGERSPEPTLGVADGFVPTTIPLTDFQAGYLLRVSGAPNPPRVKE